MTASLNTASPEFSYAEPHRASHQWPFSTKQLVEQLAAGDDVSKAVLSAAVADATGTGQSLVRALLERNAISDVALRDAMARIFNLPIVELHDLDQDDDIADFPAELANQHLVLPLHRDGDRLVVAVADPTQASALRAVRLATGHVLDLRLAAFGELGRAVMDTYSPRIVVKSPDGNKTTLRLSPGDLKIGRADHNEIILSDPSVSATHAILRIRNGAYQIVDLGSRNGVFVNDERVKNSQPLQHKDTIRVGATELKFKLPTHGSQTDDQKKAAKRNMRMRAAWIHFSGRIIAQMLGAAALIILGLTLGGMW